MAGFKPHWVLVVAGKHRCQECGHFVPRAWQFYSEPTAATITWCEPCVQIKLKGST